jgi:phage terminase large subunit
MATAQIKLPPKLKSVFLGSARVRGSYGGRGSAKTRSFAKMAAVKAYQFAKAGREGIVLCCRQFMNSLDESSLEEIKSAVRSEPWLAANFDVGEKFVRTICGRVAFKFVGLDRNVDSIKSKARILLCWVDEAEPVTETAWQKLIPTIREEDSELWVTWNPESETSPTHKRFRIATADDMRVVEMNWQDNPWFPAVLERERQADARERPDSYPHIWDGDFVTVVEGAYFTSYLNEAKAKGRIGNVSADPLMTLRAFWDIGGTGNKADATAIWIAQFIGREIRVLDYYEAQGQPLATHVNWLRDNGYGKALCILPHDGAAGEKIIDATYEGALRSAGFEVEVVPNQGKGAAKMRVEAVRRLFPSIWFNEATTSGGRKALGWYHEKLDEERKIGLGPEHDWSSHGADAFGLMCVAYEAPTEASKPKRVHHGAGGWLG